MDPNRLTQKTQEALQTAQSAAQHHGHPQVDVEHLLLALVEQRDGIVPRLLQRADVDADALRQALERELARRPRASGPAVQPGNVYLSRTLSEVLDAAQQEAQRLRDEYVSVEHVLLAIFTAAP